MADKNCVAINNNDFCDPYASLNVDEFCEKQNNILNLLIDKEENDLKKLFDAAYLNIPQEMKYAGRYLFYFHNPEKSNSPRLVAENVYNESTEIITVYTPKDTEILESPILSTDNGEYVLFFVNNTAHNIITMKIVSMKGNIVKLVDDELTGVGTRSVAWNLYNDGFFYVKDAGLHNESGKKLPEIICYHVLGENQKSDAVAIKFNHKPDNLHPDGRYNFKFTLATTVHKRYLLLNASSGRKGNLIYFGRIPDHNKPNLRIKKQLAIKNMVVKWKNYYKFLMGYSHYIVMITDRFAKNRCIMRVDMHNRKPLCHCKPEWEVIFEQRPDIFLFDGQYVGHGKVALCFVFEAITTMKIFDIFSNIIIFEWTKHNHTIHNITAHSTGTEIYFFDESVVYPRTIMKYGLQDNSFSQVKQTLPKNYNEKNYFVEKIAIPVRQGHQDKIVDPEKVKHKVKFELRCLLYGSNVRAINPGNGNRNKKPCIMIINGGFDEMNLSLYNNELFHFLEVFDILIAIVFIRGGSEIGPKFRKAGKRFKKRRMRKDIRKVAEILKDKYAKYIVLYGERNGGLAIGAYLIKLQRLIVDCAVLVNPILDAYLINDKKKWDDLFDREYGYANYSETMAELILRLSPYHNINDTADNLVKSKIGVLILSSKVELVPYSQSAKFVKAVIEKVLHKKEKIGLFLKHMPKNLNGTLSLSDKMEFYSSILAFIKMTLNMSVNIQKWIDYYNAR